MFNVQTSHALLIYRRFEALWHTKRFEVLNKNFTSSDSVICIVIITPAYPFALNYQNFALMISNHCPVRRSDT